MRKHCPRRKRMSDKRKKEQGAGMKLDIPFCLLNSWLDLQSGQSLKMHGKCSKQKCPKKQQGVCVTVMKQDHVVSLTFLAELMGPVFRTKLNDSWQCSLLENALKIENDHVVISDEKPVEVATTAPVISTLVHQPDDSCDDTHSGQIPTHEEIMKFERKDFEEYKEIEISLDTCYSNVLEIPSLVGTPLQDQRDSQLLDAKTASDKPRFTKKERSSRKTDSKSENSKLRACRGKKAISRLITDPQSSKESLFTQTYKVLKSEKGQHYIRNVTCRYCMQTFNSSTSRCDHERFKCTENSNRIQQYHCQCCGKKFTCKEMFDSHRNEHIRNDFKLVCELCGKVFKTKAGIYVHHSKAHSEKPPRFTCEVCGKAFYRKEHFDSHKFVHIEDRSCQCEICGKQFKSKSDVYKHRTYVHDGRYPYHCTLCGHGVAKQIYLKTHQCGRVRRRQGEQCVSAEGMPTDSNTSKPKKKRRQKVVVVHAEPDELVTPPEPNSVGNEDQNTIQWLPEQHQHKVFEIAKPLTDYIIPPIVNTKAGATVPLEMTLLISHPSTSTTIAQSTETYLLPSVNDLPTLPDFFNPLVQQSTDNFGIVTSTAQTSFTPK